MRLALALLLSACHHGDDKPDAYGAPQSCWVRHDGGVTQCFDEVGPSAKQQGPAECAKMHGTHQYHLAAACPESGILASCTKGSGTDVERVERCYRDEPSCAARCEKASGVYVKY
jgi:hypothetical protein